MLSITELLEAKGYSIVHKGGNEIAIICPNAASHQNGVDSRPSFNLNTEKMVGNCLSCGFSMSEAKMTRWLLGGELEDLSLEAMALRAKIRRIESVETEGLSEARRIMMPPGEPWAEDGFRGISLETYSKLGAVHCKQGWYSDRICFPVYLNGELIGVDARALAGQEPKYLRNKGSSCSENWIYPYDLVREAKPKYVILAEGIFHSCNCLDKGFNSLAYFGVNNFSLSKLRMVLSLGVEEVWVAPDKDRAGFKAAQVICSMFQDWVPTFVLSTEHMEEGKDLGDLTKEEIQLAIDQRRQPEIPKCLPTKQPHFGSRCVNRGCDFNEGGKCRNAIW